MLKVVNISTGYAKRQILYEVTFEVLKGEIVLLVGSNGSGKSTLLKTIYGRLPIWNNGEISFNGQNITGKPTATLLSKGLLYIPQKNNLFSELTVKENLEMSGLTLNKRVFHDRFEKTISTFQLLVPHLNRTPSKLSGGEKQLLSLAMATIHQPKMILLDEPLTGLSSQNIELVISNIKILNENFGISLLIVEQRVKEILVIINKILCLKLGKLIDTYKVTEAFHTNQLNNTFI